MTREHPALRSALHELSGRPPALDDLPAAVERRARRIKRRRRAGRTGVSGAVALGVVAAVLAARVPVTSGLDVAGNPVLPTIVPSLPGDLPLPTSSPSPGPTRSPKPTPSEWPSESPSDSPDPTTPPADHRLRVALSADPNRTETATFVGLTLTWRHHSGTFLRIVVDYGDGVVDDWWPAEAGCPSASPDDPAEGTYDLEHAYRKAGTYTVSAHAEEITSCEVTATANDAARIDVAQGADVSNGPYQPTGGAKIVAKSTEQPGSGLFAKPTYLVRGVVAGSDRDGWVDRITVDWGDGTNPEAYEYGTDGCEDTPTTWPDSSRKTEIQHSYAQQGPYVVTVTIRSVGCDGEDAQEFHPKGYAVRA